MNSKLRMATLLSLVAAAGALGALGACGEDPAVGSPPDASADAQSTDTGMPVPDGAVDGGPGDTGTDAGGAVTFTVPAGGGAVDFHGSATKITFTFPASAAGTTITLAPATPADIGWPAGQFAEVVQMGPEGTRFVDPVTVKPEKKGAVSAILSFAGTGTTKGPASPLTLAAVGDAFELRHFSALVIVPPGKLCDSEGYGTPVPNSPSCASAGAASTLRTVICKGLSYCVSIDARCCVDPNDAGTGCTIEQQVYGVTYTPTGSNGGQYPYCEVDAGDWDGGASTCTPGVGFNYSFTANGGCTVLRDCSTVYKMTCDGTTCTCSTDATTSGTFAQAASCDTTASMRTAYVQKCNLPGK
ncbi:MAG: hypothetical protein JWP87_187 [Labilithrix sp.]|nr:hypothetical protein [Labilithrix sp.]